MKIVFDDNEIHLLKNIQSGECDDETTKTFCNTGDVIQITGVVKDSKLLNTILNIMFELEDDSENPLGLDVQSVATQENCITEGVKKEIISHIDKCKELLTGDQSSKIAELGATLASMSSMLPNALPPDIDIVDADEVSTHE